MDCLDSPYSFSNTADLSHCIHIKEYLGINLGSMEPFISFEGSERKIKATAILPSEDKIEQCKHQINLLEAVIDRLVGRKIENAPEGIQSQAAIIEQIFKDRIQLMSSMEHYYHAPHDFEHQGFLAKALRLHIDHNLLPQQELLQQAKRKRDSSRVPNLRLPLEKKKNFHQDPFKEFAETIKNYLNCEINQKQPFIIFKEVNKSQEIYCIQAGDFVERELMNQIQLFETLIHHFDIEKKQKEKKIDYEMHQKLEILINIFERKRLALNTIGSVPVERQEAEQNFCLALNYHLRQHLKCHLPKPIQSSRSFEVKRNSGPSGGFLTPSSSPRSLHPISLFSSNSRLSPQSHSPHSPHSPHSSQSSPQSHSPRSTGSWFNSSSTGSSPRSFSSSLSSDELSSHTKERLPLTIIWSFNALNYCFYYWLQTYGNQKADLKSMKSELKASGEYRQIRTRKLLERNSFCTVIELTTSYFVRPKIEFSIEPQPISLKDRSQKKTLSPSKHLIKSESDASVQHHEIQKTKTIEKKRIEENPYELAQDVARQISYVKLFDIKGKAVGDLFFQGINHDSNDDLGIFTLSTAYFYSILKEIIAHLGVEEIYSKKIVRAWKSTLEKEFKDHEDLSNNTFSEIFRLFFTKLIDRSLKTSSFYSEKIYSVFKAMSQTTYVTSFLGVKKVLLASSRGKIEICQQPNSRFIVYKCEKEQALSLSAQETLIVKSKYLTEDCKILIVNQMSSNFTKLPFWSSKLSINIVNDRDALIERYIANPLIASGFPVVFLDKDPKA